MNCVNCVRRVTTDGKVVCDVYFSVTMYFVYFSVLGELVFSLTAPSTPEKWDRMFWEICSVVDAKTQRRRAFLSGICCEIMPNSDSF